MAWPTESPAVIGPRSRRGRVAPPRRARSRVLHNARRGKRYLDARGKYRVFNAAEYRFYRSNTATPPAEGDTPYATSATLPATPADTFANGTWLISVSYFNGVIDSGFLPLGPNGETYLTLIIAGGTEQSLPPNGPLSVQLVLGPGGTVRVVAVYAQNDANRADEWAVAYTDDGSTPPEDTPDETEAMPDAGLAVLDLELGPFAHGTTVKVRVQTRRGGTIYSDGSTVLTVTADAQGPAAPEGGERWAGPLPEEF